MSKRKIWKLLRVLFVITILLTFTPVITPRGKIHPELFGMPYTLWISILQSVLLVVLTFIGTRVHPFKED